MRKLTDAEHAALLLMIQRLPQEQRQQVMSDLEVCSVEEVTPDGSRLQIYIPGYDRPPYRGQHAYQVGGHLRDGDGEKVEVTLYADENDRPLEVELLKWGEEPLRKPDWATFSVAY